MPELISIFKKLFNEHILSVGALSTTFLQRFFPSILLQIYGAFPKFITFLSFKYVLWSSLYDQYLCYNGKQQSVHSETDENFKVLNPDRLMLGEVNCLIYVLSSRCYI